MKSTPKMQTPKNVLIVLAFSLSALIGFALLTVAVWGDVEASMFDISQNGEKRLGTLSCPVLITPQDEAEFSAKFHNPIERAIETSVRVHISGGHLTLKQQENYRFELAPNETRKLAWPVNPEDAAYGKMVLVKVYRFRSYPIPSADATCGILVLDLPTVTGKQIVYGSTGLSFLGMIGTVGLWRKNNPLMSKKKTETFRSMAILAGSIVLGLGASLLGYWLVGSLGLVIAILLTVGAITQSFK